jgi:DNA replication protein DnaC
LESYSHIELTEDEQMEAIIEAKRKKERRIEELEIKQKAELNRKALTSRHYSYDQTYGMMIFRAGNLFGGAFKLDHNNRAIFELLCLYFAHDEKFVPAAVQMGVDNPSLEKGILIAGNFGVGKTWLMRVFARNQLQVFQVHNAKDIADLFEKDGVDSQTQFIDPPRLPVNDIQNFYHRFIGLCIDDMGTEREKNNYGNRKNVIGDLIELRYSRKATGHLLHITTNLNADQLKEMYGGRVTSRLREIMNIIHLTGEDRRK